MTRLIRSCRTSGWGAEPRRCAPGRAIAGALAASFAVLAIGGVSSLAPSGSAFAQTPGTAGPVSLGDLFTFDGVDLKSGAEQTLIEAALKLLSFRGCPQQAKFKVTVAPGDPLFQGALANARRDVIKALLEYQPPFGDVGLGIRSNRFEFNSGIGSKDDVQVDYDPMQDKERPALQTSSTPPKGTKVKPGDPIKVTMTARDDATTWQTGIQSIQLVAQNPGGDERVGGENYRPVIRATCEGRPEPRTVEVTYTVPRNPPPIVRLTALAEDFANHSDFDIGEFPTKGDWYGAIDWSIKTPTGRHWGRLDLTFDYDGKGNLTGQLAGDDSVESQTASCKLTTQTPSKLSANLVGQYTPGTNTMSLSVAAPQKIEKGQYRNDCSAAGAAFGVTAGVPFGGGGPLGQPGLAQLLRSLTVKADGSVEANGEWPTTPASPIPTTLHVKLTLHRAQK